MEFCTYCGQPLDPITHSCSLCGGSNTHDLSDWFVDSLKQKLRSPLMLIFCIILTASSLFTMTNENSFWLGIFNLIIPIGLWYTYFAACSSSRSMGLGGIRLILVMITIEKILTWILIGVMVVISVLLFAVPSLFSELNIYLSFLFEEGTLLADSIYELGSLFIVALGAIVLIAAIILALMNIFFIGSISKSVKSVIDSFKYGENCLKKFGAVKGWLIVFCIFLCIAALSDFSVLAVLNAAVYIIGTILTGKIKKTAPEDIL